MRILYPSPCEKTNYKGRPQCREHVREINYYPGMTLELNQQLVLAFSKDSASCGGFQKDIGKEALKIEVGWQK